MDGAAKPKKDRSVAFMMLSIVVLLAVFFGLMDFMSKRIGPQKESAIQQCVDQGGFWIDRNCYVASKP